MTVSRAALRLVHGDGPEGLLRAGEVDVVITDPPYTRRVHRGVVTMAGGRPRRRGLGFAALTDELRIRTAHAIGQTCRRWALVFCADTDVLPWVLELERAGLEHFRTGYWRKVGATPQLAGNGPALACETVVIAHRPGRKRWNGGGHHAFWSHAPPRGAERTGHPTQKPVALMRELVALFSEQGELVCDPFSGVATTGVACRELGRRFLGFEEQARWHRRAVARLGG